MARTALALLLALTACAHPGEGGAQAPPDGAALYRRNCGACHRLKGPDEHDAATWSRAVERFGARLSPEEREAVTDFLVRNAGK